jgi:SanA protein
VPLGFMAFLPRILVFFLRIVWICAVLVGIANWSVVVVGNRGVLSYEALLPKEATGLVLGTSPRSLRGGGPSPFFEGRIETAARLYHEGHLLHLVLSGDNRKAEYNEPAAMKEALQQRGVPESAITLDSGGYRTMETVLRARTVFGLKRPVLITDDFHLPRALFLSTVTGLDAVGFASASVPWRQSYRARIREWFSRVLAVKEAYQRTTAKPGTATPTENGG